MRLPYTSLFRLPISNSDCAESQSESVCISYILSLVHSMYSMHTPSPAPSLDPSCHSEAPPLSVGGRVLYRDLQHRHYMCALAFSLKNSSIEGSLGVLGLEVVARA